VVTWHSRLQDGSGYGVYGQRFDAAGSAVGSEFKVNTHVLLDQVLSRVTALPDGGWLVTWASFGQDGSPSPSWGTYGQRYTAGGAASGAEFKVSTYTPGAQMYQSVAVLSDGGWVVTWADSSQDSSYWGVYGQRYRADGQASGGEFRVNTTTAQDQHYPAVAALTDGGWVVTWADSNHDGSGWGVYGQRYRSDGNADQKEFRINTTTANDQHHPGIAALSDGGWVVAWQSSGQDGSGWGIYARRYNSSGIASGEEFRINTTTAGDQQSPAVAALPDGGWVVAWQSADQDGSGWGVYGQRYSAAGVARGAEFRLSAQVAGDQTYPELAAALNGENPAIAVWQSPDGSMAGAFAARVAFPAIEPPAAVAASVTTDEDTIKTGMLAATGGGSQSLTYSKVANPANGTVTVNADGTFTYTPNANFNGTDWFKFKASNGELESAPATVTVTVLPVDDEPIGEVTVHGIAIQGQSLTASHSLADADGLGPVSYQWQANSLNITGATGSALTLKQAQIGKVISVVASYTDIQGTPSVVSSAPTSVVVGNTAGFPSNQPLVIAPSSMSWPRSVDNATIEARWAPSSEFYGALYSWIRFDSQTGEISGTPPSAAIGYTRIQLRARYDDATDEQLTLGVIVTNEAGGGDVLGYVDVGSEWGLTTMPKPGVRDTVQPLISKVAPYEAAAGWPIDTPLYFRFSERVERGEGTITIRDEQNRLFESFSVAESLNLSLLRETSLRLTPSRLFESGTTYVVSISPDAFNDFAGNPLRTGQNFRFTTIANGQTPNVFVDVSDSSGREGLFFVEHSIKGPATMIGVEGWDHYWLDDVGDRIVDTGNDPKDEDWLSTGPDFSGRVVDLRLHPGVENLKPYFFSDHGYIGIGNELSNRFFMGTVFDDEIYGNGGNDVLEGGEGNDTMDGGPGDDEFQVLQLGDKIIERPGEGFDVVRIHDVIGYTIDPDCEVEAVYLTGGATLSAGSASRAFVYLDGVINNREARLDSVKGEGGNEAIFGFGGAESIFGGGGDDLVSGDGGNDYLVGGAGNDRVDAGKGDDVMVGGDGAGDDTYAGGEGIDTVRYPSALAAIRVNLSQGSAQSLSTVEALDAGIGTDVLIGVENVIAGHFGDWIQGDHQSNRLEGLDGNDTLIGSGGPDVLVGGGGNDSIDGGAGDDTVVFAGQRQAYLIQRVAGVSGQITVSSAGGEEGTDTLTDIEFLLFADGVPLSVRNANIPPSGRVEIDGLAEQGQTLTAINTLADADGIGQISCQWRADGANIAGATGTTLTLAQGLVGKAITLVVSYIDQRNTVESITSTATAAVVNVNDAPVANGLSVTAVEDSVQIGMLTATDLDSLNLTYSKVSNPAHGTVAVSSNGLFIYTPAPDFNGTDSFTFKASDGFLDSETATVVITVSPVDDPVTRSIGIKGTAGQGLSLSANLGSLFSSESAATADQPIRYEWRADNAVIAGVGGPELALTPALTGKSITVRVHLFDGQGTDDLVVSNPIGPVVSASVAGEIRYWRGNKPLPNTDIQLFDPDSRPLPSAALAQTQSGADGSWSLPQLDFDTYQLNASKATTVSDLSSVSASDVLAALKLSLGRNPNADPDGPGNVSASAVSRYQLIASDVTQDGLVRADDAVLIMRAAMGRANPQISRWSLLTEALDSSQAPPPAATAGSSIEVEAVNGTISNWIGVLLGDVDGSWGIGPGL
jgi:Ca2+-binding RTX toxin-like protein